MTEFYEFRAEAGDEPTAAELLIFDTIGNWEEIGEVSAKGFAKALGDLPKSVKRLDIHINSPGGNLFDASAIYSRLADHKSEKIVYVDGLAASAATIVAMVGHKIYIRANGAMMVHLPSGMVMGNADDMRKMAGALDTVTESMINVYAKRSGQLRNDIRDMLAAETWFSPEQAVEKGFADEVRGVVKAAAIGDAKFSFDGREFDLSRFHNVPAFAATQPQRRVTMSKKVKAQAADEPPKDDDEKEGNGNGNGEETKEETKETTKETPTETPAGKPAHPQPQPPATSEYQKGVQAERTRVIALLELDRPATHATIAAAIKDGKQVADVVSECFAAMEKATKQSARYSDASALNGIPPSDGAEGSSKSFGSKIKEGVQARMKQKRVRGYSRTS